MHRATARLLRALVLLGLVSAAAVELWRVHPAVTPAIGPDADIVLGCEWLLWAVAGYLCLAITATVTAVITSSAPLARLAPPVVRRLIEVALSTGLSAVLAGTGVAAATTHAGPPSTAAALDWPGLTDRQHPPAEPHLPTRPSDAVVVRAGDSLWSIAARHLAEERPGRPPTYAEIAAAWPRWWQANRAAIGADPNLIRPGQHLTVPPDPPVPTHS
jgi:nucleoid-associated protein YgaU